PGLLVRQAAQRRRGRGHARLHHPERQLARHRRRRRAGLPTRRRRPSAGRISLRGCPEYAGNPTRRFSGTHDVVTCRSHLAAYQLRATHDPKETRKAREAFAARFEREVDPDGLLSPDERTRRADGARRAYFTRLAL